jgi:hypothetical protein
MGWVAYTEPIEVLYANDVNNIKENIEIIRNLLIEKGLLVDNTIEVEASERTQFVEMFDFLSNIEYNLDIISDNNFKSAYYVEPQTIGDYGSNREDIWRWVQILNDMHDMLLGVKGSWGYMICTDGIPTIDGKTILIRGDNIG